MTVGAIAAHLDFYLATRIVEIPVHTDDLAVSVGPPSPVPPPAAATVALQVLLDASRTIHGDLAVLRSFSRRERGQGSAPSVF